MQHATCNDEHSNWPRTTITTTTTTTTTTGRTTTTPPKVTFDFIFFCQLQETKVSTTKRITHEKLIEMALVLGMLSCTVTMGGRQH
ncbi:hypothetical protein ACLKA6_013134 [Drosophila palustris]